VLEEPTSANGAVLQEGPRKEQISVLLEAAQYEVLIGYDSYYSTLHFLFFPAPTMQWFNR